METNRCFLRSPARPRTRPMSSLAGPCGAFVVSARMVDARLPCGSNRWMRPVWSETKTKPSGSTERWRASVKAPGPSPCFEILSVTVVASEPGAAAAELAAGAGLGAALGAGTAVGTADATRGAGAATGAACRVATTTAPTATAAMTATAPTRSPVRVRRSCSATCWSASRTSSTARTAPSGREAALLGVAEQQVTGTLGSGDWVRGAPHRLQSWVVTRHHREASRSRAG